MMRYGSTSVFVCVCVYGVYQYGIALAFLATFSGWTSVPIWVVIVVAYTGISWAIIMIVLFKKKLINFVIDASFSN